MGMCEIVAVTIAPQRLRVRSGFTIIEILLALALVLALLAIGMPRWRAGGKAERDLFVQQLNGLVGVARQHAMMTQRLHTVVFDLKKQQARVEMATGKKDDRGNPETAPIRHWNSASNITWPDRFTFRNFFIDGTDEIGRYGLGSKAVEIFFYVVPDGLTQEVTLAIADKEKRSGRVREIHLILNPFTGQFDERDASGK